MDSFHEKKWFVYQGDHHEGPFSLAEIENQIAQGKVSNSHYVWADGMDGWKMMTDVEAFKRLNAGTDMTISIRTQTQTMGLSQYQNQPAATQAQAGAQGQYPNRLEPQIQSQAPIGQVTQSLQLEDQGQTQILPQSQQPQPGPKIVIGAKKAENSSYEPRVEIERPNAMKGRGAPFSGSPLSKVTVPKGVGGPKKGSGSGFPAFVFLLCILAGIGLAYMQGYLKFAEPYLAQVAPLFEKVPYLNKILSPIPALTDVSDAEYDELRNAARGGPSNQQGTVAIALAKEDPLSPAVYVAGNVPLDIGFDVHVIGVPETLLNHTEFVAHYQGTIHQKLGKSPTFKFPDGKVLARGEYVVYVVDSPRQSPEARRYLASLPNPPAIRLPEQIPSGRKLLAVKRYFLGGKNDSSYQARLREYHNKLQERATHELEELRQFVTSLESQLESTRTTHSNLAKLIMPKTGRLSPARQKIWDDFSSKWTKFAEGLSQGYSKWTPEYLKDEDYFYASIYSLTRNAGLAVQKLHQAHQNYFTSKQDPKAPDALSAQALLEAQNAVTQAKNRLTQAEQLKPTPNGMPRREEP